jgi:hypothetical protein
MQSDQRRGSGSGISRQRSAPARTRLPSTPPTSVPTPAPKPPPLAPPQPDRRRVHPRNRPRDPSAVQRRRQHAHPRPGLRHLLRAHGGRKGDKNERAARSGAEGRHEAGGGGAWSEDEKVCGRPKSSPRRRCRGAIAPRLREGCAPAGPRTRSRAVRQYRAVLRRGLGAVGHSCIVPYGARSPARAQRRDTPKQQCEGAEVR